jgi:hypothetical protein
VTWAQNRGVAVGKQDRNGRVFQVNLPTAVRGDAEGVGDLVKRATNAIGIRPCGGCERRADALNRAFPFPPRQGGQR